MVTEVKSVRGDMRQVQMAYYNDATGESSFEFPTASGLDAADASELPEALPQKQSLRGYAWSSAKSMGAWALGYGEEADPDKVDETPNTNKVMV